jgi:membrane fusion protein, heavy metal efflux system
MFLRRVAAIGGLAVSLVVAVPQAYAHEGHVHADEPPPVSVSTGVHAESASAAFELVAIAKGTALEIYLDDFATNKPISGASIEVETPEGPATAVAQPDQPYRLDAPFLGKPGRYDLVVTVTAGSLIDVLPLSIEIPPTGGTAIAEHPTHHNHLEGVLNLRVLGALAIGTALGMLIMAFAHRRRRAAALLIVLLPAFGPGTLQAHEGHVHEEASTKPVGANGELAQRLADDTIFVPKPVQRILAIGTLLTELGTYSRSVELPGRIIPDPNASGLVQPSAGGRLSPPPGGFPQLGSVVKQGDVLAYLTPHMQAIDVSDMRQRQGELDQQMSIVERKLARYEQLASSGAVARSQLEEARLELQGLRDRRTALDKVRHQPEALSAPVSGVIAEGTPVAGQMAHSTDIVFHIVDPARLWVEALSFDAVSAGAIASAQTATGRSFTLSYRGAGLAGRSQSIPVHFAIEGDTGGLRAGQFVTVLLTTEERKQGITIPRTALVRDTNGQDFVFEHVSAERFARRAVRFEPLDGERVIVLAGVERGTRIVAQGAELIGHIR